MADFRAFRFLLLALAVSFSVGLVAAAATHALVTPALAEPLMAVIIFSPGLLAVALAAREGGRAGMAALLRRAVAWRVPARWYVAALLLPAGINGAALLVYSVLSGTAPSIPGQLAPEQQLVPVALLPLYFLLPSFAEELGWRGYALPRLQVRRSALGASLVIGGVWALWHLPWWFLADSTQGTIPFGWYVPSVLALAVVFTWLHNSTGGSLVPVTLLHASVQATNVLLPVLPTATGDADAYKLTVVVTVLLALALALLTGPTTLVRRGAPSRSPSARGGFALFRGKRWAIPWRWKEHGNLRDHV